LILADKTDKDTLGIVLLNLGGPDSLKAVMPFLYNLFSDRQIIQLGPQFLQKPLAWLISTIRSKKTERFYNLIGGKSPIREITTAQAEALEELLNEQSVPPHPPLGKGGINGEVIPASSQSERRMLNIEPSFKVYVGMRYWHPLIEDVVPIIFNDAIRKIIALSLYPQYSVTTSGSSLSRLKEVAADYPIEIFSISSWFKHPLYIEALVDVIKKGLESFSVETSGNSTTYTDKSPLPPFANGGLGGITEKVDKGGFEKEWGDVHILFSAHSLPYKIVEKGDPYVHQIMGTIEEITKIIPIKWHLSYQSKSGPVKWLEPSTDEKLKELAAEGIKNILVVPISFVSDHIETLYEIDILYKNLADKLGLRLKRVDSLNTHPIFIRALKDIVMQSLVETGWD
jgi:ferrochelatase